MAALTASNGAEHLELFSLVWLDNNLVEKRGTQEKLRAIINYLKKFHDIKSCQNYIEQRPKDDRIVLIVNGQLGRHLVLSVHNLQQVFSIYVYCMNKQDNEQWAHDFTKVKQVVTELDELISYIQADFKIQKKVSEPLTIMYSTTEVRGQFVFSQCLIDCLLRMEYEEEDKTELIALCMDEYIDNDSEKARIDEFKTSYLPCRAIWWYTRESFVYKTLNAALRKQSIHMMFLYRSFIFDLWKQLADHQSKIELTVYRSQLITKEELEILKGNVDQLISVNSFFSSSCNRDAALFLLGDTRLPIDSERVLFEIVADFRKVNTKPFANITMFSQFAQEEEVLFMLGSIFRIKKVIEPAEDKVWVIQLELCSDEENDLVDVLIEMKSQNGSGKTNLRTLGKLLLRMGKIDHAEYYYQLFLDRLSADALLRKNLYEDLAEVAGLKHHLDANQQEIINKYSFQYERISVF
ncbi:unnamed protein product [Adineta ricciae]|uniref:Uncharacterized protein n=1 Tax=Adineta ricciae TaxID=249248 RepID=A0A814Y5A9_ADIRI|nr:unnamed protein product [Adineta ricciae]